MAISKRRLLWILPSGSRGDFQSLFEAYRLDHVSVVHHFYEGTIPRAAEVISGYQDVDAILVCGDRKRAPSTVLPGPCVERDDGKRIPASWFPITNHLCSRRFSLAAAQVHLRKKQDHCVALLSQWHPKYLKLADSLQHILSPEAHTIRWTSDVIGREDVVHALGSGLGLAIYLGHGRPKGWVGYYGMRGHHFDDFTGDPSGGILSLCCRTASRKGTALSFVEALVQSGAAACSFGAIRETRHTDNTRWAVRISEALKENVDTIGELIIKAMPLQPTAYESYRLIGDPLAPLRSTHNAKRLANAVKTYA